jgi:predicted nucleic acid-binding protein
MDLVFLDTNAVVKLYIRELGSRWLRRFIKGRTIYISELTLFEITTVVRRRHLEGQFTEKQARNLINRALKDSVGYEIIELGGDSQIKSLLQQAFNLPTTMRLRALDGILMVAASIASDIAKAAVPPDPFIFVSSDVQFLRIMQHQGYTVENPEDHP